MTAPEIRSYMRDTRGFAGLGGYQQTGYELSGVGAPAQINASRLTGKHLSSAGRFAVDGPRLHAEEDEGSQQVAVISYQMWHSRFHGDATTFLARKSCSTASPTRSSASCRAISSFRWFPAS